MITHKTADYRHKITIESYTNAKNSDGEYIKTWSTYYTCKAKIVPLNGQEYFQSKQVASSVTNRFRLLYCAKAAGINNKMRVLWNSTYYDIESVINPEQKNREILLMAVEKNA